MKNFDEDPNAGDDAGASGGSLADAISAHLELKKEHGADPEEIAAEEATALGAANRDEDSSADLRSEDTAPAVAETEPDPVPEPATTPEPDPDPAPVAESKPEPEPVAHEPEQAPPAPEPAAEADPAENTGSFEFEFGQEETPEPPTEAEREQAEHDLLEDTPDFFQETPEHDKLWFDEAPPKKFDF